jgi:hypothetical protein
MTREPVTFDQARAALEERFGMQVAVLIESHEGQMLAIFRGILRGASEELSTDARPRFVVDDGQGVGSYDETSFILDAHGFEWGYIRTSDDSVVVAQATATFTITPDEPKKLPIRIGS